MSKISKLFHPIKSLELFTKKKIAREKKINRQLKQNNRIRREALQMEDYSWMRLFK